MKYWLWWEGDGGDLCSISCSGKDYNKHDTAIYPLLPRGQMFSAPHKLANSIQYNLCFVSSNTISAYLYTNLNLLQTNFVVLLKRAVMNIKIIIFRAPINKLTSISSGLGWVLMWQDIKYPVNWSSPIGNSNHLLILVTRHYLLCCALGRLVAFIYIL